MDSLNHDNQADVIEAFNSTSRYLGDILNIDNPYFENMVNQIYPPELQLNKANTTDTEPPPPPKKKKKWAQLYYLLCTKARDIYCMCIFYLNEQTIYLIIQFIIWNCLTSCLVNTTE